MKSLHSAMLCKSISNRVSLHKIKFYIIMPIYCTVCLKYTIKLFAYSYRQKQICNIFDIMLLSILPVTPVGLL